MADKDNNAIRTIGTGGIVATLAGTGSPGTSSPGFVNGAGDQASFSHPTGVAFDPNSDTL